MIRRLPQVKAQTLETQLVYDFSGGINDNANQITLANNQLSDGLNMVFGSDKTWSARGGFGQRGNFLGSTTKILGSHTFYKPSADTYTSLCVYDTDIYVYSAGVWTAQSQSLTTNKRASFTNGTNIVYFCNGYNGFRKWDGTTWTAMANFPVAAAAATDQPNGVTFFKERIIAWNSTTNPNRIWYSDQAAETIGTSNYFDVLEPVKRCIPYGDEFLLIFTENYIYRIDRFIFTGFAYDPDRLKQMIIGKGCIAERSIVHIGNFVYYLSRDGVKQTDGVSEKEISHKNILNTFNSLSQSYLQYACGGKLANLYYIAASSDGIKNDTILTYDTEQEIWYPIIQADGVSVSCFSTTVESNIEYITAGNDVDGQMYVMNSQNIYDEEAGTEYTTGQDTDSAITGSTTVRKAQSFQLSKDLYVNSVELLLKKVSGTTTDLTIRIETDSSGPTGTLISSNATTTITSFSTAAYTWKKATFVTPFMLYANTTYWLVCQHATEGSGTSAYAWGSDGSSPTYSYGSLASYSSGSWTVDTTKDLLFRVNTQNAYEKYIVTKSFFLGDPQKRKQLKKIFVDVYPFGNYNMNVGVNSDEYTGYNEQEVNLLGGSGVWGTGTWGTGTWGTKSKVRAFLKVSGIKGRSVKLRFYNNQSSENLKVFGSEINYRTINVLR